MKIAKENNRNYSKYIEQGVVAFSNNLFPVNNTDYIFSKAELSEMNADAQKINDYIGHGNLEWIGNSTSLENGDIKDGETIIELKYTGGSNGTHYNTSINYFATRHNLIPYRKFLQDKGYYILLKRLGVSFNIENLSPVSEVMSKEIRYNHIDIYKQLVKAEKPIRDEYVQYLANYFMNNDTALEILYYDMLEKNTSGKKLPDRCIIFNHCTKNIKELFYNKERRKLECSFVGSSLIINNMRCTLGWQNGTGLNNPTMRVFLGDE